jgi:hypothetical protein
MRHPIHEIWRDTYFDVIEEWRQRYGNGHLEIRKIKMKDSWMLYLKKTMVKSVIYLLFSYQTGYIMWHSQLMIYIPFGYASGNIDPKPGMSHYIPCLIAPRGIYIISRECHMIYPDWWLNNRYITDLTIVFLNITSQGRIQDFKLGGRT